MAFVLEKSEKKIECCPVCDHDQWSKKYSVNDWDIDECVHCQFSVINPLPVYKERKEFYTKEKIYDRIERKRSLAKAFFRSLKSLTKKVFKRDKSKIFRNMIHKSVAQQGSVLDIGCGDGTFLKSIKDSYKCYGIEISDFLAELAKKDIGEDRIILGNFQDNDFAGHRFDAITMISLIEHLEDPYGSCKKCYDLLKEKGVFILKTPNYNCLNRFFMKAKWSGFRPPDHIVHFSSANLKTMLLKAGFKKVRLTAWPMNDNMYCLAEK